MPWSFVSFGESDVLQQSQVFTACFTETNTLWSLSAGPFRLSWISSVHHSSTLHRWKLGLWLHASNKFFFSLVDWCGSSESCSLVCLQSFLAGCTVCKRGFQMFGQLLDNGFPCQRMECLIWHLTSLADTVPGLQFIDVAEKNLATHVLFFPVSWHLIIWVVCCWNLVFAEQLVDPMMM